MEPESLSPGEMSWALNSSSEPLGLGKEGYDVNP